MSYTNDNSTTIAVIPEYSLIYDVKTEGLRDKTYQELKNEFSEKVIRCPCSSKDKVFDITSNWVRTHFNTQKHNLWKTQVQKDHIQTYGHCSSSEDIINILTKEMRSLKCYVSQLTSERANLLVNVDKLKQDALKTTNEVIDLKWEIKKAGEENTKLIEDNAKQLYFNAKLITINKKLIAENAKLKCEEIDNETFVDCD
jgi:regulator of replication initiation timing